MLQFQFKINSNAQATAFINTDHDAAESNSIYSELKNAVTEMGETLTPLASFATEDVNKLAKVIISGSGYIYTPSSQSTTSIAFTGGEGDSGNSMPSLASVSGKAVSFISTFNSSGSGTTSITWGTEGTKLLKNKDDSDIKLSQIKTGMLVSFYYNGTNYVLIDNNRQTFSGQNVASIENLLNIKDDYPNIYEGTEYWNDSGYGGAPWIKTGNTGIAGTTDFPNRLLIDANGDERVLGLATIIVRDEDREAATGFQDVLKVSGKLTPAMFGGKGDTSFDSAIALQTVMDIGLDVRLDRRYYTSDTIFFPKLGAKGFHATGIGKNISGIYTRSDFAGTAISVASINRSGSIATVVTNTPHNLLTGDQIFFHGADQHGYNGFFRNIVVSDVNTFTIKNIFRYPQAPASVATGTIFVRKCKPVLAGGTYTLLSDMSLKDFTVLGANIQAPDFGVIDYNYFSGNAGEFFFDNTQAADSSIYKTVFDNVEFIGGGGSGLHVEDVFSMTFQKVFMASFLHHGCYYTNNLVDSVFNDCYTGFVAPEKACYVAPFGDITIRGNNAINIPDYSAGSYFLYAGNNAFYDTFEVGDKVPNILLEKCNFEGKWFSALVFLFAPQGTVDGCTFHNMWDSQESYINTFNIFNTTLNLKNNKSSNWPDGVGGFYDTVFEKIYLNSSSFTKNAKFIPFLIESDKAFDKMQVIAGDIGVYGVPNRSTGYEQRRVTTLTDPATQIDAPGESVIELSTASPTLYTRLLGYVEGDVIEFTSLDDNAEFYNLYDEANVLPHFNLSSLNDEFLKQNTRYSFKLTNGRWLQMSGSPTPKLSVTLNQGENEITTFIPNYAAIYDVLIDISGEGILTAVLIHDGLGILAGNLTIIETLPVVNFSLNAFETNIGGVDALVLRVNNVITARSATVVITRR
jgi:hypothetical protein